MSDDPLLCVEGLERYYGRLHAVRGLEFTLSRGEALGLLGPNGAGKTTTLQMLSGALAPSAGSIRVAGMDLLERPVAAKRLIGYLPERPPLYRELTVDEYLRFCARLRGVPARDVAGAVARAAERCGVDTVRRRLLGSLSKGYQQRVGIAQAIVHSPALVLLDEPTVGLDPLQIREIRELIRELASEHGVIVSTHILPEVQVVCDRVQIMRAGALVLDRPLLGGGGAAERSDALRVGLHHPPADEALLALPGATAVQRLAGQRLRLRHRPGETTAEALAAAAVDGGWGLFELVAEERSLEELFIELTCGDAAGPAEAA